MTIRCWRFDSIGKKICPGRRVTTDQGKEKFEMKIIQIKIGKTTVRYNRTLFVWQAINGRIIASHPPYPYGKLNAIMTAVLHEAPNIAHLCRSAALRRPELTEAIWDAAGYVINHAVTIPAIMNFENHLGTIQEDEHHFHSISLWSGCLTCDRADCAHTIAYLIQVRLWQEDCGK